MKAKHTPGPWKYALSFENNAEPKFMVCTKTFGGENIATIESISNDDGNVIAEANAKLIALSPEMYSALKGCVREMWKHTTGSKALDDALRILRELDPNFKTP